MSKTRDYYADLELPPTADIPEIKKQFRKLALKYHPDRNPGREQEVNAKFQIIQSAHEILSDPDQKSKYDETRVPRNRYPAASGVRGNPWANAGANFPPPPRRNQPTRATPSGGAQRWQDRFSQGVPPTAKQNNGANPGVKESAARAFENMRKSANTKPTEQPRPNPPPPPPRSESAKQRAQASFGTRKTGYYPRSATHGDEPPVASSNYNTNYNTRPVPEPPMSKEHEPSPMPDPLRQFREQANAAEPRTSSPYTSHTSEKTNPFDGVPLNRAKSAREPLRNDSNAPDIDSPTRQRSSTVPKEANPEYSASGINVSAEEPESPTKVPVDARPKAPLKKSRAGQMFGFTADSSAQPSPATETPTKQANYASDGPSMYATPPCTHLRHSSGPAQGCRVCKTYISHAPSSAGSKAHQDDATNLNKTPTYKSPSGAQDSPLQLTPFERQQQEFLARLIRNAGSAESARGRVTRNQQISKQPDLMNRANMNSSLSFSFPVNDDTFAPTTPGHPSVSRSSTDDINTRFVNDDGADAWHFSAGGSEQGTPTKPRPPPGSRPGRHSPHKRPALSRSDTSSVPSEAGNVEPRFDPEGWSKEFGPHTFVPPPPQPKSASPSRSMRGNSKKGRHAKTPGIPTGGDSSSEEEELAWPGRKAQQAGPPVADSPQAMDIDSPPAEPPTPSPFPTDQIEPEGAARNINVEPSRPEWRPGNGEAVNGEAKPVVPPKVPFNPNAAGSEDSEEFLANFSELKNVPPFAKQDSAGLKNFDDMKSNLPFDSKASTEDPKLPEPERLAVPSVPVAPALPDIIDKGRKPHVALWEKYVQDFERYLQQWDAFNNRIVGHFSTRKTDIANFRKTKGYSYLEARDDKDVLTYLNWLKQDRLVRKKWDEACDEHEQRYAEFMRFRARMKS